MKKLKEKWGIISDYQMIVIFTVFAINGSLSVMLIKPIINFIGISAQTINPIVFWTMRILLMFVIYQILLVIIGTLLGQHKFFWNMEKKMLSRLGFKKLIEKD